MEDHMRILDVNNLHKDFLGTELFSNVSFSIDSGDKIACIGRNGSGKTTLIRIILGLEDDYKGRINKHPQAKIGYVAQKSEFDTNETCAEVLTREANSIKAKLSELEEAMSSEDFLIDADSASLPRKNSNALEKILINYQETLEAYDEAGGDSAHEKSVKLLHQLGLFGKEDQEAKSLSGGEKNILALALAVRARPDLLILDEPGNHLDFKALAWLELFLKSYQGAVLLISHDRRLIDNTVNRILDLHDFSLTSFTGNYSAYRLEKLKNLAAQGLQWNADKKRVERLTALVARFAQIADSHPDPAWGKRLRSRRALLERVKAQAVDKPEIDDRSIKLNFTDSLTNADIAISVTKYFKSFDSTVLFENAEMNILAGERTALVGLNGSGKTSFIKDLIEQGSWDSDSLRIGPSMKIGYCAQNQEIFPQNATLLEVMEKLGAKKDEAFKALSRFLFSWNDLDKKIASLSGGELNRLQLARAVYIKANFLILDEPTNHLDIEAREAIEEGLEDFEGTILVVSHDRYFLEKIADRIIYISDKSFIPYEGSFSEFFRDRGASLSMNEGENKKTQGIESRSKDIKKSENKGKGNASAEALTARIEAIEKEMLLLEKKCAEANSKGQFSLARKISMELEKNNTVLHRLYAEL